MMYAMDYDAHEAAEEAKWERKSGEAWKHPPPSARAAGKGSVRGCGAFRRSSLKYGGEGGMGRRMGMSGEWAVVTFSVAALLEEQRDRLLAKTSALDEVMKVGVGVGPRYRHMHTTLRAHQTAIVCL